MKHLISLIIGLSLLLPNSGYSQNKKNRKTVVAKENVRQINVDFNKALKPTSTMFKFCIGAGRANEGLRADWQEQLKLVKKEMDFKYIRMHGLLTDDMGVYAENKKGEPIYNWQYVDVLFDFLLSIDIKPFVELSFMPKALATGDKAAFWWKGNITPPKSYDKWHDLIKALAQHVTNRYGTDEVRKWYFEVWNEPNHPGFWTAKMEDYFKLYEYSAKAIKSVDSTYRVGGPATAGSKWVPEIIKYCTDKNVPLDFISTHTYAVAKGFFDETGETGTLLMQERESITKDVLAVHKSIKASSLPNLELHFTEWSASYSGRDPVHDVYQSAPFILGKIKDCENITNSMSYWVFTDIFEEGGPAKTPFHGGFGLLNLQGIKKPSFYSYKFLNELGETELQNSDSSSWVCKSKNDVQALFWNLTIMNPNDSMTNRFFYSKEVPSPSIGKTSVKLSNLKTGTYFMQVFKVGYRQNDVFTTYLDLGAPSQLSKEQEIVIKSKNNGNAIEQNVVKITDGVFMKEFDMKQNDVYFLKLKFMN